MPSKIACAIFENPLMPSSRSLLAGATNNFHQAGEPQLLSWEPEESN